MKCFVITSGSEIIYTWFDDDFKELLKQSENESATSSSDEIDLATYALDVFSFLASFETLLFENNESFCFVQCKNEFLVCFQKYDQFLYVGLSQNDPNQTDKIFREIGFIKRSVEFLFGPAGHFVFRTPYIELKKKARSCIDAFVESYIRLSEIENAFLLEGIEEIQHLNEQVFGYEKQVEKCVNSFIKSSLSKYLQHIMIFVGSKLLCSHEFSSRATNLTTRNILQIIALIHSDIHKAVSEKDESVHQENYFKPETTFEDVDVYMPTETQSSLDQPQLLSNIDGDCLFDNTDIISLASTVTTFGARSRLISGSESNFGVHSLDKAGSVDDVAFLSDNDSKCASSFLNPKNLAVVNNYFSKEKTESDDLEKPYTIPVFFSNKHSPSVPSQVSCIPLDTKQFQVNSQGFRKEENSQVKMVLICKPRNAIAADPICAVLFWLKRLSCIMEKESLPDEVKAKELEEKLNRSFDLIYKKTKGFTKDIKEFGAKMKASWQNQAQKNVKSFLQAGKFDAKTQVSLRRFLQSTEKHLLELHKMLFPSCIARCNMILSEAALSKMQLTTRTELLCYMQYLHLKNQQNISITPYLTQFPGMVHFALVQRVTNVISKTNAKFQDLIYAPSISTESITSGIGQTLFSSLHKEFLFFVHMANSWLVNGKQSCVYLQKGFKFTSCIKCAGSISSNVDDSIGKRSEKSFKSPSLFSSSFYERCPCADGGPVASCPCIYQLIAVHFDCISNETITQQREQLFPALLNNLNIPLPSIQ